MKTFDEVVPIHGFLTDHHISEALQNGYLIEWGTFEASLVRHASYTLRLGDTVHISRKPSQSKNAGTVFDIVRLSPANPILRVRPGETALLYSMEYLRFPPSVLGFTVVRGLLFTHPLVPENTYVDPGFTGSLYTTITNISGRVVELEYGMPIARLFFYKLAEPVASPYRPGAGVGIPQYLVTQPLLGQSSPEECQKETWENLLQTTRQMPVLGNYVLEELFRRLQRRLEVLYVALVLWPLILIFINTNSWIRQNFDSIVVNILAGIIATGLTWLFLKLWERMRK
ncbi:MAG: hypothetical protein FJ004_09785 [Chloroflexi bacterium]|nr:hypothetical protein [Chloroflexota bacterium]